MTNPSSPKQPDAKPGLEAAGTAPTGTGASGSWWRILAILGPIAVLLGAAVGFCRYRADHPAPLDNYVAATAQQAFACDDTSTCEKPVILLTGELMPGQAPTLVAKLRVLLDEGRTRIVCMDSPGGDNDTGLALMNFISANHLDTCLGGRYLGRAKDGAATQEIEVKQECNSMCSWVIESGHERHLMSQTARVGFHETHQFRTICGCEAWTLDNGDAKNALRSGVAYASAQRADDAEQIRRVESLFERSFRTPHDEINRIGGPELLSCYRYFTLNESSRPLAATECHD